MNYPLHFDLNLNSIYPSKSLIPPPPQVLPFLTATLEQQFQLAAAAPAPANKPHVSAVTAALNALGSCAEWAPLGALHQHRWGGWGLFLW